MYVHTYKWKFSISRRNQNLILWQQKPLIIVLVCIINSLDQYLQNSQRKFIFTDNMTNNVLIVHLGPAVDLSHKSYKI